MANPAIRAVVAVPFCDTEENHRSGATLHTLRTLAKQLDERHVIIPVDNGSTDLTAWEWLGDQPRFASIRTETPLSIAQGVNSAWRYYEDQLAQGEMVAIKHDSDTVVSEPDWLERIIEIIQREPRIGLMGPWLKLIGRPDVGNRGGWFEMPFLHGAISVRSPVAFRAIGYARNPHGRWGHQDHWDVFRVHKAGLICGIVDIMAYSHIGRAVFSRAEKVDMISQSQAALSKMQAEVRAGKRDIYEPYEGM